MMVALYVQDTHATLNRTASKIRVDWSKPRTQEASRSSVTPHYTLSTWQRALVAGNTRRGGVYSQARAQAWFNANAYESANRDSGVFWVAFQILGCGRTEFMTEFAGFRVRLRQYEYKYITARVVITVLLVVEQ